VQKGVTIELYRSTCGGGTLLKTVITDENGDFIFTNVLNGSYIVEPEKTGFNFSPKERSVVISGDSVSGVDFTADDYPGDDYCSLSVNGPCPEGLGDCDGDSECESGLICVQDMGDYYGWPSNVDVCEQVDEYPGDNYCALYGPCKEGIGDCDADSQCASGLKCINDVGADYGWPSNVDVCEQVSCGG